MDRAALDSALACGVACGGWCPSDRLAEDGVIPESYPLRPAPRPGYRERTLRNVLDSDGTVVLYYGALSGGTEETLERCLQLRRPYQLVDAREINPGRAAEIVLEFIRAREVTTLNIAGPRASQWEGGYEYAARMVTLLCNAQTSNS